MIRLQNRIAELSQETEEERLNLKEMHKERVRLNKDREVRQGEIAAWESKCKNIQMLKFGRLIDVDALEAGSDRSKEVEAERTVRVVEEEGRLSLYRMQKELEEVQEKLARVSLLYVFFFVFLIFDCFFIRCCACDEVVSTYFAHFPRFLDLYCLFHLSILFATMVR